MKKIEAFIRPEKLDAVVDALEAQGYAGLAVSEVRGHGKQRGKGSDYHGEYRPHTFNPKVRLELVVRDEDINRIVNALQDAARTKEFGDGKIFISQIEDAIRIRTGQRGDVAL
jgi:nitrogen regulatory protein P-II 1